MTQNPDERESLLARLTRQVQHDPPLQSIPRAIDGLNASSQQAAEAFRRLSQSFQTFGALTTNQIAQGSYLGALGNTDDGDPILVSVEPDNERNEMHYLFRFPNGAEYNVITPREIEEQGRGMAQRWARERARRAWIDRQQVAHRAVVDPVAAGLPTIQSVESYLDVDMSMHFLVVFSDGEKVRLRSSREAYTSLSHISGLSTLSARYENEAIDKACEWRKVLRWLPATPEQAALVISLDGPLPEVVMPTRRMDTPDAEPHKVPHRVRKPRMIDNL